MDFAGFDGPQGASPTRPAAQQADPATRQQDNEPRDTYLTATTREKDVKLPPFCATDATSWFQRIETTFRLRHVRNETCKADYVVAALPPDAFPLLSDWLVDQGENLQYKNLKNKILSLFAPTPETRAAKLLQIARIKIGTQRASAAYQEMKALIRLSGTDGERLDLLRVLWLYRLPKAVRNGITNFTKYTEDQILELADSLQGSTADDDDQAYAAELDSSSSDDEIAAVPYSRRYRRKSPAKKKDTTGSKKIKNKEICYYHARFGKEARNCKTPCIY